MKQCMILIPILATLLTVYGFFSIKYSLGNERANFPKFLAENKIVTSQDWGFWTMTNLTYIDDGILDYWGQPYETLEKLGGDCEDFAFLNVKILKMLGYEAIALGLSKNAMKTNGHAICLFYNGTHWKIFDNQYLKPMQFETKEEALSTIKTFYNYKIIYVLR